MIVVITITDYLLVTQVYSILVHSPACELEAGHTGDIILHNPHIERLMASDNTQSPYSVYPKHFTYITILFESHNKPNKITIIIPLLKIGKLRPSPRSPWQQESQDASPGAWLQSLRPNQDSTGRRDRGRGLTFTPPRPLSPLRTSILWSPSTPLSWLHLRSRPLT